MPSERTARVVELSRRFRELAGTLRDRAFAAFERGEITKQQFRAFDASVHRPLLQHAIDMLVQEDLALGAELEGALSLVEEQTRKLEAALATAAEIGKIAAAGARIVTAAASVAAFALAPSAASGAAAAEDLAGAASALGNL